MIWYGDGDLFDYYKLTLESTFEYFADPDPTDSSADSDGDGLTDAEEYEMSNNSDTYSVDGRAVPTRKDIFVEVDWMEGHEMKDGAKWRVGTRFLSNPTGEEIWLHLDTPIASSPHSLMGGGEEVPHCDGDTITYDRRNGEHNDFGDYYDDDFSDGREDRFHYCLMADRVKSDGDYVGGTSNGNFWGEFTVADGEFNEIEAGSTFMHELGHTLGLSKSHGCEYEGIDNDIYDFDEYPSVMNYNAPDDYYRYSDGYAGDNDFNDWDWIYDNVGYSV